MKEDSGLYEMQDHVEYPVSDLDAREEEEIGACSVLIAWATIAIIIVVAGIGTLTSFYDAVTR